MSEKFHINLKGKPAPCHAQAGNCPRGGASGSDEHFSSLQDAEEYIIARNEREHGKVRTLKKPKLRKGPKLSDSIDMELLNRMLKDGYISVATHPEKSSLKLLNYSRSTQYEGKWNDATKMARGLIVESNEPDYSDAVIVERPWKKFFTLSQIKNDDGTGGWALGDEEENASAAPTELDRLDFDAPAEVTDKMDGSLGILYEAPDGKLALSTKGSFVSEQANMYTEMLRENEEIYAAAEQLKNNNQGTTFMFELIGPENQIVVAYDEPKVVFIGAVDKKDGKYRSVTEFEDTWSNEKGLETTEVLAAHSLREALQLPPRENREGVVVMLKNDNVEKQMQIKIKQDDYLKIHRLLFAMNKKSMFEFTRDGVYEEQMAQIPATARKYFDMKHKMVVNAFNKRREEALVEYEKYKNIDDKKELAFAIKDVRRDVKGVIFAIKDGKDWEATIWNAVWRYDMGNININESNE